MAFQLKKNGYEWTHLQLKVGEPILQQQGSSSRGEPEAVPKESYFAVETLGRGDTSRIFGAYDAKGNRCVI